MNFKIFFSVLICLILFFFAGYKMGDSRGYEAGYNEGYRYDCKDEIAELYSKVKHQTTALLFTDSVIRSVLHENDSLKRKEFYQKRFEDSIAFLNQYSIDSLRYSSIAWRLNDSLSKAVGAPLTNVIQDNGERNIFICTMLEKFRNLKECRDDFNLKSMLDKQIKKSSRGKK